MRHIATLLALVLVLGGTTNVAAQQERRQVTGRVTAADGGQPLSSAGVQIVGTRQGVFTDAQGNFRIAVSTGPARLRISLIGFKSAEIDVGAAQTTVTASLGQDVLNIDEIVVTGQATTVAKRNLANAVGTVNSRELTRAPAGTLERAVQGKLAGVTISANSGAPGGGLQINMRGVHSINAAADPLYVIDGVIASNTAVESMMHVITRSSSNPVRGGQQDNSVNRIADLNPNDIERIEVLKGASASAIYGSKATNGVVVITTKRGAAGKPRIAMSQKLGQFRLANKLGSRTFETVEEAVTAWGERARDYFVPGVTYDHEEELAGQRDLSYETSASVSGGDENTRYFMSGLLKSDKGIVINTGYDKESVRLNLDQKMSEKIQVGLNMNLVHSTARRGVTNNDNSGTSYWYVLPFTPNFVNLQQNADGTWPLNPFVQSNPLQTANLLDNPEKVWRMITSAKADIQLQNSESSNLKLVGNAGVDFFNQLNSWYSPPDLQFEDDDGLLGTAIRINTNNIQINGTSTLVHTWKPASEFLQATTSAGMQYEVRDRLTSGAIAKDLIGAQTGVDQGTPEVREKRERQIDMGVYAQEEVMLLDEKLLLTAGIRADRSSNAGDPEKFFFYPKVSASYRFANLIPRVDELKFRLAYGESGNQPLFSQKYTKLVANRRAGGVAGLQLDLNAGDPDIKPERAQELEGGVDLNVFGGRATIEASAYRTVITDLLLQRGLAPSSGFTTLFFNAGELLSWGYEGAIAGTPIQSEQLTWLLRTTYTMSRNKVQNLPIPSFLVGGFGVGYGTFRIKEGEAITNMVGTRDTEVAILGSSNPDFRISLTNDITVAKRLTLYALLDWQKGATIANVTKANYDLAKNGRDYEELGAERWTKFGRFTENWIDDASFVKLREVSLAYDVPPAAIEKLWGNLQSVRLSLVGRDLKTWTDYWGMDPEVSNFGAQQFARNIDHSPFPPSRSFWFGIDLSF